MKMLFLTNFYPPFTIGGMENRCQQVVDYLQKQGHEILVLTSIYGNRKSFSDDGHVYRVLYLEADMVHYRPSQFFTSRHYQEKKNLDALRHFMKVFKPDVIFVWGMWNLSKKLPAYLELVSPNRVIYSLASDWPAQPNLHMAYWQSPAHSLLMGPFKYLVGQIALTMLRRENTEHKLKFDRVVCVSYSLKDILLRAGIPLKDVRVIYPGIDFEQFAPRIKTLNTDGKPNRLSILYAGALVHHKGVHTAIESMAQIKRTRPDANVKLTILGSGHPDYERFLKLMVSRETLHETVQFIPQISRDQMPEYMKKFDVLVFPSIWEEPFSRVLLEAMAVGLVVVGTKTGGTQEILVDNVNGLTFNPEDSASLARCIEKLLDNSELQTLLSTNARDLAIQKYDIRQMNEQIENYVTNIDFSS